MTGRSFDHYWSQPLNNLLAEMGSAPAGLSTAEAARRLQQFAPNILKAKKTSTLLNLFLRGGANDPLR